MVRGKLKVYGRLEHLAFTVPMNLPLLGQQPVRE